MPFNLRKYLIYYPFYKYSGQDVFSLRRYFEKTQWLPWERLQEMQFQKFQQIIEYAYNNIPFYKRKLDGHKITPEDVRSEKDILDIPILQKEDIVENFPDFFPPKVFGKVFPRETSGSSGTPLRLAKGPKALGPMDGVMYRNYGWFGIDIGEKQGRYWGSPLEGIKYFKTKIKDIALGRKRFSPFDISERACLEFVCSLRRFRPTFIYGYAQTIYRFARFLEQGNIYLDDLGLKCVILTGEMIYPHQAGLIENIFKCPVSNEYGCTELGIIAMQCPEKGMHLMVEHLYIEFLNGSRNALPGEEGDIVLTELFSDIMPLIRYRVGDVGVKNGKSCECGRGLPLLKEIKGRADDFILCPDGKQVDPIVVEYILQEIPRFFGKVTQFRITQKSSVRLDIELCYEGNSFVLLVGKLEEKLKNILGNGFEILFHKRESIEREASGKLRCFISQLQR